MQRLTLRLAVALLSFAVGISAASLWLYYRHSAVEKEAIPKHIGQIQVKQESKIKGTNGGLERQAIPEPRWFYVTEPFNHNRFGWGRASIVIFYVNGEWGRVNDEVKQDGKTFDVGFADGYSAEIGNWKEEGNGVIVVTIEKRRCYLCGVDANHTAHANR